MADSTQQKIQQVLSDLIDKYGLVFWYDEGGQMQHFVDTLDMQGVEVLSLQNNAFSLKYRILKGEKPERGFILYSPEAKPADEDNWLLDLQMMAALFSADMGSLYAAECGIPLELKEKVVDGHLEFFKIADNRKRLTKRLRSNMDVDDMVKQMQAVVCKTEPTCDQLTLALANECLVDSSDMFDKLTKYNLVDSYWQEVKLTFGYDKQHRIKDFLIVLFNDDMNRHFEGSTLHNEAHIFMRDWRDSRQYGELYKQWAERLEVELGIYNLIKGYDIDQLVMVETFPCVDKIIAMYLQNEVLEGTMSIDKMESIVDERVHKIFYSVAAHTIEALLEARRMMEDIDQKMQKGHLHINSAEDGFQMYQRELYTVDMHYRHYFREERLSESKNLLADVTKMVERKYTNSYLMELANKWQPLVDNMAQWRIDNVMSQRLFFEYHVAPFVRKGNKLFVIISDALRYETMVEMEQRIAQMSRMVTTMKPALLSTQPSYTQLGMAALLPNRELSYEKQQDEVFADGISTKGTDNRKKVLSTRVPLSLAISSKEFLEITSPKTYFRDFDLIYIYSNKIDFVGDKRETEKEVFKATEEEFDNIVKIVELIRNGNGSNILITSDHGYLYQNEELDESEFTDFKVMGDVITDTRRFIIGNNLQPGSAVKTWESKDVGLKEGRQVQIAKGMIRMRKQGSGSRFVHGGSMLQEIVVPVLHVNIKKVADVSQVDVDILNKRAQLTTNNQTISFFQSEAVTEKVKGLTLRMGFYDAEGNLISDSLTMVFDSDSSDTTQREQRHIFMFKNQLSKLNGQEVTLRMERQVSGTEQFVAYKEVPYKVKVMFQAEF